MSRVEKRRRTDDDEESNSKVTSNGLEQRQSSFPYRHRGGRRL